MGKTAFDKSASESCLPASAAAAEAKDSVCIQAEGKRHQSLTHQALESNLYKPCTICFRRRLSYSWDSSPLEPASGTGKEVSSSPGTLWDFPSSSDSDSQTQSSASGREGHGTDVECSRNSLDSVRSSEASAREDDLFDEDDSTGISLTDSVLKQRFGVNLGISQRKSLLNSLSERDAAREAEEYGFSPSAGMPGGADNHAPRRCMSLSDATMATGQSSSDDEERPANRDCASSQLHSPVQRSMSGSSLNYLSEGQAAAELFLRLNHARQTVGFVRNQAARFSRLDRGCMTVWEALDMLGSLREYETALLAQPDTDPGMPLLEHCFQTAEACRVAYPKEEEDWFALVGLIHQLGKLLGHARIAGEPQWAICGESFPVGCRFDHNIGGSRFFSANPDRRSRQYSTQNGLYRPGGGLASVYMSWSAAEYLYMLLLMNQTLLPPEALFIIRYQKFHTLEQSMAYRSLMCKADQGSLHWLAKFRALAAYKRAPVQGALTGEALTQYYSGLIRKYIPAGTLRF